MSSTEILPTNSLFLIDLKYVAPLDEIEALIPDHISYLEDGYEDGVFFTSGRKEPRTGGVILATGASFESIRQRAATDPFVRAGLAEATITEFVPSRMAIEDFQSWLGEDPFVA